MALFIFSAFAGCVEEEGKGTISLLYNVYCTDLMEAPLPDFEKATGIKVEAIEVPPATNIDEKIALDLAGGVACDVIMVDTYRIPEFAQAGYLLPLDEYVKEWPDWNSYYDSMKEMVEFEGRCYGIPIDTDVRMLWYSKSVFEKAGIPVPWKPKTWDDVLETAKIIKERCPEVDHPLYLPAGSKLGEATSMQGFYMLLLGADTPVNDRNRLRDWDEGKWIGKSPAILKTLEFYEDVFVNYVFSLSDIYYRVDARGDERRALLNGEIGIDFGGSWEFREIWKAAGYTDEDMPSYEEKTAQIGWAPVPGCGDPGAPEIACVSGGTVLAINAKAKDLDKCWELVKAIFTKENYEFWVTETGKVSTRKDVAESSAYQKDRFIAHATTLLEHTTMRDTYPGYSIVSSFVQQATEDILDGKSPEAVMENFYNNLVEEFGKENVKTIS